MFFGNAIWDALNKYRVELVILAGYLKKIPENVVSAFNNRIVNIHPSLLPAFGGKGMYGRRVHQAVFASGTKISGVTVHLVNNEYDAGPIVLQKAVEIEDCHSPEEIADKVLAYEHKIFPKAIKLLVENEPEVIGNRVEFKKDQGLGELRMIEIKRALISCWDKEGLLDLVKKLAEFNIEIISSGGTAAHLESHQIPVTRVEDITGSPEVLGGRVKTLHPKIHAALLAKQTPEHLQDLKKLDVEPIQLVVVNLYPFVDEAVEKRLPLEQAVEFIDIGGPTMLRAAAKNFQYVAALHQPGQYQYFLQHLDENSGCVSENLSQQLAQKVFFYTSWYDGQIQTYLSAQNTTDTEARTYRTFHLQKKQTLRYGENPHQQAAVYQPYAEGARGLSGLEQLWGKPLSYNNYIDVNAAYELVLEFDETAAVIVKHTNPCGAAASKVNLAEAFSGALRGDSLSAFGGIVAFNRTVDGETAEKMAKIFFECIIAPDFENSALEILQRKKNLRLLKMHPETFAGDGRELKLLNNTYLVQEADTMRENRSDWSVATKKSPSEMEWAELEFAWEIAKHVKSNAIVLTKNHELYGTGAGQMSRIDSVKIAKMKAEQAGRELSGVMLASDAFFPFRDGIDEAVKAGVSAIIQPGGSIRDEEVIQAANDHNISMVFTGIRHFKH